MEDVNRELEQLRTQRCGRTVSKADRAAAEAPGQQSGLFQQVFIDEGTNAIAWEFQQRS